MSSSGEQTSSMKRLALLSGLLALVIAPVSAGGSRLASPRQTSIFYYPWYSTPAFDGKYAHWNQNGDVPPLDLATTYYPARGPYSSSDPRVVDAQMSDIASAGIQEVVSSWWGWGSPEDARLPLVMREAASHGLSVAVQIEPYAGRTATSVVADIAHLHALGISRFYIYQPFMIDDPSWSAVLASLRAVQVWAQTVDVERAHADGFAGIYTYDVLQYGPKTFGPLCARAHSLHLLCAPSVGPGFDALRATGDTRIRPRDDGATYDAMWKAAISAAADRVTITSYNEWHEGTQIEPARTRAPRTLAVSSRVTTSPVVASYATYDGAYGFHGRRADRAYLARTAYWTAAYRRGVLP
jgi:hypothetical protein